MNAAGEQSYKNEVDRYNQANPNSKVNYTPRATYNTAATVTQQNGAYNVGDRQFQNQQSAQDWASTQGMTPQAELNVTPPVSALEQHVTEVQKTAQQEAADKVQGDYYKMYQTGEDLVAKGILKTNPYPQTYDEYLKNQAGQSQQQIDYQIKQNQIASTLDQNELARAKEQGAASIAGVTAAMAQGREGVMGTSKPLAAQGFKTTTEKVIGDATLRVQSAENARAQALKNLEQAQASGNENMIKVYSGQLANAEEEIRKSKIDLMDAETKAATAAASIAQSQANTAKIKTETLQSTFEAMGESAANLDVNSLVSMADNAGLSYGQVAAMRDMSVLTAQLGKAKSQGEIAQISANIARIQKELDYVGMPAGAQEYEYYSKLSPAQKAEYENLKAAGYGFEKLANGSIVALNQATGAAKVVYSPTATGSIPTEPPIQATIGNKTISAQPIFMTALQKADADMFAATGQHIQIGENFRTYEQQKAIRDKFGYTSDSQPSGYNGLPMAAPPGTSFHEKGLAVDVSNWKEAAPYLAKYGIVGGLQNDMNHFSMGEMNPQVFGNSNAQYVQGADPIVDSWVDRIQNGTAKITEIPASQADLRNKVSLGLSSAGLDASGKPTVTEMGKEALKTAQDLMTKFNNGTGTSAVGGSRIFGFQYIPGTAPSDFSIEFDSLKNKLSLDAVKYLKGQGQVSDSERAMLQSAVTGLNLSQSEEEFKKTLQDIIDKLSGNSAEEKKATTPPPLPGVSNKGYKPPK